MKRILITPGEPAGIGPDITLHIAQQPWACELIAVADPDLLRNRAKQIGLPLQLIECDLDQPASAHQPSQLRIHPVKLNQRAQAGKLNPFNADYVIRTLSIAASLCVAKKADAIVTGPVHKEVINASGTIFTGHTEFFADYCQVPKTIMLFVVDQLKVALMTTHLPLTEVAKNITQEGLLSTLSLLHSELKHHFSLASPRLLVCGLNPHAGEGGYLGREEIEVITPALDAGRAKGYLIEGPLPADTIFTPKTLARGDVVLAMYHDQALPVVKFLGFGHAVNVTLGLPFVRTSVDHGTAIDVAGTQAVDPGSMRAALALALNMISAR